MPIPRLYDALELIKKGQKQQARSIVRDILRQDRENVAAWWLMANLLEDEEKVLKCLHQLLQLDPEHRGAQRKLSSMRSDLAHHFAPPPAEIKEKPIQERLIAPPSEQANAKSSRSSFAQRSVGIAFAVLSLLIVFGLSLVILFNMVFNSGSSLTDNAGNTPQQVTEAFIKALWLEDAEALYRLSCPDYHSEIDAIVADFSGYDYSAWTVDTSQINFDLFYYQDKQAYVTVAGTASMLSEGQSYSINWNEEAHNRGFEGYGEHLYQTDSLWQICISRTVPGIE
jgi:hypothetical protein